MEDLTIEQKKETALQSVVYRPDLSELVEANNKQLQIFQHLLKQLQDVQKKQKEDLENQQNDLREHEKNQKSLEEKLARYDESLLQTQKQVAEINQKVKEHDENLFDTREQFSKAKQEVKTIKNNVDTLQITVMELDNRVSKLEQQMQEVQNYIEEVKKFAKEQKQAEAEFKDHPKLVYFYFALWARLDEQMGASKFLRSNKIGLNATKKEIAADFTSKATMTATSPIPIFGGVIGGLVDIGITIGKLIYGEHRMNRLQELGGIHPSSVALYTIAELLSRQMALEYKERIICLKNKKNIDKLISTCYRRLKSFVHEVEETHGTLCNSPQALNTFILDANTLVNIANALKQGIIHSSVNGKDTINVYIPPDYKLAKSKLIGSDIDIWTINDFLQQPGFITPCSSNKHPHSKLGTPHYYPYKESEHFLFRHVSKGQFKNPEAKKSLKDHKSPDPVRPANISDPFVIEDAEHHPLSSFEYKKS